MQPKEEPEVKPKSIFHEDWTKENCLDSLRKIHESNPDTPLTRDFYRHETGVRDITWTRFFGTFEEFKRQAGLAPSRGVRKLENDIAKHASNAQYRILGDERKGYEGMYIRDSGMRYKTILVASDLHDIECDKFFLRVLLDTAKRAQPDVICIGGDLFDLPEFGKYTVDPREWDVVKRINFVHEEILKPLRENCPNAQFDLIEGNHECVSPDTNVLTDKGWVKAKNLKPTSKIASYSKDGKELSFDEPIALQAYAFTQTCEVVGRFTSELISQSHRIDIDGELKHVKEFIGKKFQTTRKRLCINADLPDIEYSDDEIRMFIKMVSLSEGAKSETTRYIEVLNYSEKRSFQQLFDKLDLPYTCTGRKIYFNKQTLKWYKDMRSPSKIVKFGVLSERQLGIVCEELVNCKKVHLDRYGRKSYSIRMKTLARQLQKSFCFHGVPTLITTHTRGGNLFPYFDGAPSNDYTTVLPRNRSTVVAIQTKHGTLITNRDDKINFTGNCRLIKHLSDATPALKTVLSDLHGFTIQKLLGLDKFEMNYIAKADMKAWTQRDLQKEVANNYKIYWDSFLVHHLPQARSMGMPGCHGHHHRHFVWSAFSPIYGAYEWHQLGCGHKRNASYCEGERWGMGFALVNIDTEKKTSSVDYVPVSDFAVSGGKWYVRNEETEPKF